jgi:hypothetical protein
VTSRAVVPVILDPHVGWRNTGHWDWAAPTQTGHQMHLAITIASPAILQGCDTPSGHLYTFFNIQVRLTMPMSVNCEAAEALSSPTTKPQPSSWLFLQWE